VFATVSLLAGLTGPTLASAEDADWAQLKQYRDENQRLRPPSATRPRVVFLGDSLTQSWDLTGLGLDEVELLNRGISGQTTPQMLVRFRQDVVSLKPAVVHILAGTNDLAGNTGPTTLEAIEANLSSMVEIAEANHIRIVLASVLPALDYPWRRGLQPAPRIVALNDWIRSFAGQHKLVYADYYSVLVDSQGGFKSELADDGVHPNRAGYAAMDPIARQAVRRAVAAH
jgi:lysophospholipase L1-like esterase